MKVARMGDAQAGSMVGRMDGDMGASKAACSVI